jgi:hypothetical protein
MEVRNPVSYPDEDQMIQVGMSMRIRQQYQRDNCMLKLQVLIPIALSTLVCHVFLIPALECMGAFVRPFIFMVDFAHYLFPAFSILLR